MTKRVAVTGFSFRFPGTNTERYWQDLLEGRDLVTEVDSDRWSKELFHHPNKKHPGTSYTFAAGSIGDVSRFDAAFFGISPREAAQIDPQQRLLLEMSWEALENSGIVPSSLSGSQCGVFIGIASADYSYRLADDLAAVDSSIATGNTASIAANRISYIFDLSGPSMALDTACSSSLVAFHQACQSILSGECIQAFTGGISLHLHPYGFVSFAKASMLSPRGRCSVFDASGDGYVRSEGGGIFFLKDYDQAIRDGNPILAVVANSCINMDGRKSGLTVPNPNAQIALLKQAYAQANIDPGEIDYLEAHGTGTAVGDPIEALAIGTALGKNRPGNKPLPIGSVKSNLGHLETASGVAGLVKAIYCLEDRKVPATIGFETPNPAIEFQELNIKVVSQNLSLKKNGKLIIGVNSFGFGGANSHVILESHQIPKLKALSTSQPTFLPIILSAKTNDALKSTARDFFDFLSKQHQTALYDIAYNTALRREWHDHRLIIYGTTAKTIARELLNYANDTQENHILDTGVALKKPLGPAFIYSGNGSQWPGMGKQLLNEEPLFRRTIQEIDVLFRQHANFSLEDELEGKNGEWCYENTEIAQPALFAIQVGITVMFRHRGLEPVAVAGHSVGEVAAAWASGILTLEEAVKVIYHRSRLQGTTKGKGAMTAVGLGHEAALNLIAEIGLASALTVAGINSSRGVTIAGRPDVLTQLETTLATRDIFHKRLNIDYAFHSPVMDEIEISVKKALATIQPQISLVPFYSSVTGKLIEGEALNAEYWWSNIRKPVLFEQATKSILADGTNIFIEIGPHAVLRSYINTCMKDNGIEGRVITTATEGKNSPRRIWRACSQAVISGANIDWQRIFSSPGEFIQLPNYPWQRERHWHTVTPESLGLLDRQKVHVLLGYPLWQQELTWENQLDTQLYPVLADHLVGDANVFPGTGFSELALAAAFAWQHGSVAEIEGLEIRSPLFLSDDHTKLIRVKIEALDGSITIKGKDHCSTESWVLHAVARILAEPQENLLRRESPLLPSRQPDFTNASHEMLTRNAGLTYGPAFQCIDYGWLEGDSALGVFRIPESIENEIGECHLHPAILDCTFQLIIQLLRNDVGVHEGITFVPTRMGRLSFRKAHARPAFAEATLLRRAQHSLTAEFTVFDSNGLAIAVVKDARFRSIRLGKKAADHLRYLYYHGIPSPHILNPDTTPIIPFKSVQWAFVKLTRSANLERSRRRYTEELDPLLDMLCDQFTREALQQLSADGQKLSSQKILTLQTAHPEIAPFFDHLLANAKDDQSILQSPDGLEILPNQIEQASAQDIWNSLVSDYPDFFDIIHSVGRVGMHLKSILDGSLSPTEIHLPDQTIAKLTGQIFGVVGKQKGGQALRDLIAQGLKQLPEGRRLGIIEISDGSPSFALDACVAMDPNCCDYIFASISTEVLESIAPLRERFSFIDTRLIDPVTESSEILPSCQIAIVTLNFSTPQESMAALKYARACLTQGGSLIVLGLHPSRWVDFVFGTDRKHWSQSKEQSLLSNQVPALFWKEQLQQLGFTSNNLLEFSSEAFSGPYLLLVQPAESLVTTTSSHQGMPRSWVLLADQTGLSAQLSNLLTINLQSRGDIVVQACPDDTAATSSLLLETTASYGQLNGIIYLAGLCPQQGNVDPDTVVEQQINRCSAAASIIQACEISQTKTTCWLITTNAVSNLLPDRHIIKNTKTTMIPGDTGLWGFGRTLINEASNYAIRMIDLETPFAIESIAIALERELEQLDNEQEIILTALGERYVPRLRVKEDLVEQKNKTPDRDPPTLSLGFLLPGQLRNLRWQSSPRIIPTGDQIEVEVYATGLNFRDIMYTLGLLPDEAIENGFAGPTLGLEFAGIVQSVGNDAQTFRPGDKVMGFGPSSFGNRVMTKVNAISHIPAGLSFEAATTIPSTFFTAYYSLHHLARLQAGERVLIHGAAGGVGIAAIQLAKWIGAEIYATAGSDEKHDFLRLLGVDHIFHSRSLSFADEILNHTGGEGVDVILNSLAGEAINRNLQVLKPFGRFLELGKRDFYENTKIGMRPFRNNISYFAIDADQLMQSQPDLTNRLFSEVMALFVAGVLHPLPYHAFEAEDIVAAFRYMQQARQIGKVVITYRHGISHVHSPIPAKRKTLALRADGSYLITGGLAGFGLKTAEWLVSKGARNLVLISRSGPGSEEARNVIDRLNDLGVNIYAASCDVTDRNALETLLVDISAKLPPLKGIVHAATIIDDSLISNMNAEQIRSVLAPKALGAYYLHKLTLDIPLDYFILFSSATTLFGNPGQGNYVAANACLDGLAYYRRASGLPATCIGWGAIDDVGFLARNEKIKKALLGRLGGSALKSAIALDVLEDMLVADRSGLGVLEFDGKALSRFLPSFGSPKFAELARHTGELGLDEDHGDNILQMLEEFSDTELLSTVIEMLKNEVGEILQVSPDKIDPAQSMYDMGLDSLMGVELVVALESLFGARLPVMALSQSPTIIKLAKRIIQQLHEKNDADTVSKEKEVLTQAKLLASQHGADVSSESIVNLAEDLDSREAVLKDQIIH